MYFLPIQKSDLSIANEKNLKLKQWIKNQGLDLYFIVLILDKWVDLTQYFFSTARRFCDDYCENEKSISSVKHSSNVLTRLFDIARNLQGSVRVYNRMVTMYNINWLLYCIYYIFSLKQFQSPRNLKSLKVWFIYVHLIIRHLNNAYILIYCIHNYCLFRN